VTTPVFIRQNGSPNGFLPKKNGCAWSSSYSPDFNPIERLWRWIKCEHLHNRCWKSLADLKTYLVKVMEKIELKPAELTSVMRQEIQRLNSVFEFYETPSPFLALAGWK
jgi:hypothetical protein